MDDALLELLMANRPHDFDVSALARARPAWHDQAACRGMGTDLFFPTVGRSPDKGREVCGTCPVRAECAEAGAEAEFGTWGGVTGKERAQNAKRPPTRRPGVARIAG